MALRREVGGGGSGRLAGPAMAVGEDARLARDGGPKSQMRHVTWSNRRDLQPIPFHIGRMVLPPQNARHGQ